MSTSLGMSYGAGERSITILNHLGLMFSWKNFVYYSDKLLRHKQEVLKAGLRTYCLL